VFKTIFNIVIATVTKNSPPVTMAKFRSFFVSNTNVFSPEIAGARTAVTKRRMALMAKSVLRSRRVNGGSSMFRFPSYGIR